MNDEYIFWLLVDEWTPHFPIPLTTKYLIQNTTEIQRFRLKFNTPRNSSLMLLTYSFFLAYHRHKMLEVSKNQTPAKTFPRLHFLLLLVFARLVCRLKCHILFIISFSFLLRMLSLTCAHVRIRKSQLHIFVFLSLCLLSFYLYVFFISA